MYNNNYISGDKPYASQRGEEKDKRASFKVCLQICDCGAAKKK